MTIGAVVIVAVVAFVMGACVGVLALSMLVLASRADDAHEAEL